MGIEFRGSERDMKICKKTTCFPFWCDLWIPKDYLLVFGSWGKVMGGFGGKGL